ncbi:MAG: DnaA regulatory inactivator Hda [Gammaproteobacteria bacterium]|nr:MAG: DnaA regulatory inactivator Hda [Gammaproteobacteria bacterium]
MKARQLPLAVQLPAAADFATFVPGPNAEALAAVARLAETAAGALCLHGPRGSGRTHLLQAAVRDVHRRGGQAMYLALPEWRDPGLLEGLEVLDLVALDGMDRHAGDPRWEEALFDLFNRLREGGRALVFALDRPPAEAGFRLPDLTSRLGWGPVYALRPLRGPALVEALQRHARLRGLELPADVATYLLRRERRDLAHLVALLDRLDRAALAARRRLTIPFVREVLGGEA